jgi:hypothetical protein
MVRRWNHRLRFQATSPTSCRYTDEVDIDAGATAPLVVAFAQLMCRWRQHRWRQIASIVA